MGGVYLYGNQLWRPIHEFKTPGETNEFTLNPGKYLMICHGAKGGEGFRFPGIVNYGGVAYGVLDLKKTSDFYAVVGGNGENCKRDGEVAKGGYNGGGDGGLGHPSYPTSGAGGGGASDIRLNDDHSPIIETTVLKIPDEYDRLEYIQSTGSQYINTEYIHKSNTKIICDCEVSINTARAWSTLFGSRVMYSADVDYRNTLSFFVRYNSNNVAAFGRNTAEYVGGSFIYDQRVKVVIDGKEAKWYQGDEIKGSITSALPADDGAAPLLIFDLNNSRPDEAVYNDSTFSKAKLYEFQIYEGDKLKAYLVPCKSKDTGISGLYDIVNDKFLPPSSDLVAGSTISDSEEPFYFTKEIAPDKSLYSRIIVAGGGGGALNSGINDSYGINNYSGYGGGVYGGYVSSYSSDINSDKYASQTDGYSFGFGMTPPDKTAYPDNGAEGASGGGGGWYGGYSSGNTNLNYSSSNGGGGSGYVLTEESDKPEYYMDGYSMEDYYFTDIFMNSIGAIEPQIIVCVPIKYCLPRDTIIAPCVGSTEKITLKSGTYKLKCWGGDGDPRYIISSTARGGYAQGTLTLEEPTDIYVNVGGAGVCPGNYASFASIYRPTISFNGGGKAGSLTDIRSTFGGGASDIRIGSNELLARVIVAGGAGGHGAAESNGNRFGGAGGGESGNTSSGTNYGSVAGPGTQNGSPTYTSNPKADGEFGAGGNGFAENSGFGGAGGGGWYGGSGCIPDKGSDDDRGGCGGSGYVLTETSYKPDGYLLDDRYYLTETSLLTGGNDLPIGMTKIEIEVIDEWSVSILCKDGEGYKRFDDTIDEWVFFKTGMPTEEEFVEYGSSVFKSDNGLMNDYELYIFDEDNMFNTADVYVVPPRLKIRMSTNTPIKANQSVLDADFNEDDISFDVRVSKKGVGEDATVILDIIADKKCEDNEKIRVYCVNLYANSMSVSNRYIPPKDEETEETPDDENREKKYLLKVGTGNTIPVEYRNYLGILNGDAISTIYTSVSCENNRMLYIAIVIKNTVDNVNVLRLIQLNLLDGKSKIIRDVQTSELNNAGYFGGLLADDNYLYFTRSGNDSYHVLYRVSIKDPTEPVSIFDAGNSSNNNFEAYGKIGWWNDHTIIIDYRQGFMLFDTNVLKFETRYHSAKNNSRRDMSIGKKLVLSHYNGTSTSFYAYDVNADTLYSSSDNGTTLPTNAVACSCYGDGKFYIVQASYLTIWDEETMSVVKTIPIPWTEPKAVAYTNGIIYVVCSSSDRIWVYDTNENMFYSMYVSWSLGAYNETYMFRPTAFNGYLFLPYWQLGVINYQGIAKYNMGYKVNQYNVLFNKEHEENCTYDSNFVTFNDSYMTIHDGTISLPLTEVPNTEGKVKQTNINKSDYRMIKKISFTYNPIFDPIE